MTSQVASRHIVVTGFGDEQWLEQLGEVELIGGWAEVALDGDLAELIECPGYQVFVTPYHPVQLFVHNRTERSFEIHALPGLEGRRQLSLRCGYRVVGRRIDPSGEPAINRSRSKTRVATAVAAELAALTFATATAQAPDKWPAKPVRMVVPFPAGGPTDITARTLGQARSTALGVQFVVENKPGTRGFVGSADVARAPADGYTLLMSSIGAMAINPRLYEKMPYDSERDFAPVSLVVTVPISLVVNPQVLPVGDIKALVTYLKANPGKVNYASAGSGGSSHLVPEYFKFRTGIFMTHIPYQGTGPAIGDLLAGHVHLMFDTLLTSTTHVKSGKLRLLAVTTAQRLPQHPEVPTIAEALGMQDFEASSWFALYAPAGTPAEIVTRLSAEVAVALKQPAVAKRLTDLGAVPVGSTPQELAAYQRAEQDKWGKVIERAHIKPD